MAKYVITGGPGVGKSKTCEELERLGYTVVPEAARVIIAEQQKKENGILPWTNLYRFQELVHERIEALESLVDDAFCDRGVLDGIAYCIEGNISPPPRLAAHALQSDRYQKVYLLDPLPNYVCDEERKELKERGLILHNLISDEYRRAGYAVVNVPVLTIPERAKFILNDSKFSET